VGRAAFIWTSGTIHAEAFASDFSGSTSSNPPDVVMSGPSGGNSASATSPGIPPTNGSAFNNFSMTSGNVSIFASTHDEKPFTSGPASSGSAGGSVNFDVTQLFSMTGSISTSGYLDGSVTMKNS